TPQLQTAAKPTLNGRNGHHANGRPINGRANGAATRPPKPSYLFSGDLPSALEHLRDELRWVSWDYVWKVKRRKWDKPPFNPITGEFALVNNPETWASFGAALAGMHRHKLAGVGFVLTGDDGIIGIDLDDCVTDSGSLSALAAEIISYGETYAEYSP